ncbi:MAG: plasmid pRiA4b ORF-3 family protein [Pirellulales bacterium]|nr:plasmid pRiA4b ORF-3 family protein [Pirellulales bacterium]
MRRKQTKPGKTVSGMAEAGQVLYQALQDTLRGKNPGMVSLEFKPAAKKTAKPAGAYPIKLTDKQRSALIHATRLPARIKTRLETLPAGPQVVAFTRKELHRLHAELDQAVFVACGPEKKQLAAVQKKAFELLDSVGDEVGGQDLPRMTATRSSGIFQFRVTLLVTRPAVWRRIQVPDCTLGMLHDYIQAAFGWWNYHLHRFTIDGKEYGPPPPEEFAADFDWQDYTQVKLSQLVPKSGKRARWIYEYDFGDGWVHEILFEGFPPADKKVKYPICLEGDRTCPPEDVGGPYGFEHYLAALANPKHKEHKDYLAWRGPFDADAFDAKQATREMRKQ